MAFTWAENYPEVSKVCKLFDMQHLDNPTRYSYTPLEPYIQRGPQCGIVALAMCLGNPTVLEVEKLQNEAITKGFSAQGEMFSAANLAHLAKCHLRYVNVELYSGILDTSAIREGLLKGDIILVPHDSSKANTPALENGIKAHWAVVCGAVETANDFFVLVRHGKIRNVGIWKLRDLSNSNAQLNKVDIDDYYYRLPPGGIAGPNGLKCKSVILKGLHSSS